MSELPFPLDPAYDYILDESDRKKFAPKLATDEFWWSNQWCTVENPPGPFALQNFYRRRKASWVNVSERLPEVGQPVLCKGHFVSNNQFADFDYLLCCLLDECGSVSVWIEQNRRHPYFKPHYWIYPKDFPALPQPPRPAAEVAFEEWQKANGKYYSVDGCDMILKTWLAAIEWAKTNKEKL